MTKVIKRDGRRVDFNADNIVNAVLKAFKAVDGDVTEYAITKADNIANHIKTIAEAQDLNVETIQDYVEKGLMSTKRKDVAQAYIRYRLWRTFNRGNTTDDVIDEILHNESDYWTKENSNKNPTTVTTQRDYVAGAVNTDITRRKLLPPDIVTAHDEGIIHFHKIIVA